MIIWLFKDISYLRYHFIHAAEPAESETVWACAEIVRVFPHSDNFEDLRGSFKRFVIRKGAKNQRRKTSCCPLCTHEKYYASNPSPAIEVEDNPGNSIVV